MDLSTVDLVKGSQGIRMLAGVMTWMIDVLLRCSVS